MSAQVESRIASFIKENIPTGNVSEVMEWVGRFPNTNGQMTIASFLVYAHEAGRLKAGLEVLGRYWKSDFQYQHPEARGSGDALPKVRDIISAMHHDAGVPLPETKKGQQITDELAGEAIIKTRNSTYHLYPKPEQGPRRMVRKNDGKEFLGQVLSVRVGGALIFDRSLEDKVWRTSEVLKITPVSKPE